MTTVAALLPLFRELNDLKRVRVADQDGSVAERLFRRAWGRLTSGEDLRVVAREETAGALAAARLAGIDLGVLQGAGLPAESCRDILRRGFDAVSGPLRPSLCAELRDGLGHAVPQAGEAPPFVGRLARQPRAGATRPGHARVMLEPAENHAEHCAVVAVQAVVSAPLYDADPAMAFLTGLAHHLHNAYLPDAGDAGDALLGDAWKPMVETFRRRALDQLPLPLQDAVQRALDAVFRSDTPAGKTFQTADVLDRVLEMEWHARSASFTLAVALHDMDIVHPGPVQAFQREVVHAAGLMPPPEPSTGVSVRPGVPGDLPGVMRIVWEVIGEMRSQGSDQWDAAYPDEERFRRDAAAGTLFVAALGPQILGFIVVDQDQPEGYHALHWADGAAPVIHRFAVAPGSRGRGIGERLMALACEVARGVGATSVRTDTYSANIGMQAFLQGRGCVKVGEVEFRGKDRPFFCFEKRL